jgi:hypothetical protein
MFEHALWSAAGHRDAQVLQLLVDTAKESDYSINMQHASDNNAIESAAYHCNIECLKIAHAFGFPWGNAMASAMCGALKTRDFKCLGFLQTNGCPIMPQFLYHVDLEKHSNVDIWHIIEFLEKVNYNDWTTELGFTIYVLLKKGDLFLVNYLSDKGCPWPGAEISGNLLVRFAKSKYKYIFLYIYKCKFTLATWSSDILKKACEDLEMMEFIFTNCKKDITLENLEKYYPHKLC